MYDLTQHDYQASPEQSFCQHCPRHACKVRSLIASSGAPNRTIWIHLERVGRHLIEYQVGRLNSLSATRGISTVHVNRLLYLTP